jgi:hypothetical protein
MTRMHLSLLAELLVAVRWRRGVLAALSVESE